MPAKPLKLPSYGVVGVEGLPGSGKSFFMVQRVIDIILNQKRPVYTNLPIKWRVLRQYLRVKGGETCANLLFEMDKAHFVAFCQRQAAKAEYMERHKVMRGAVVPKRVLVEGWESIAGPDLVTQQQSDEHAYKVWHAQSRGTRLEWDEAVRNGRTKRLAPNWMPATSVIMIDEAHRWFPQEDQKHEDPAVKLYITMHRHHLHEVWWATQNRMQVSLTFRRNTQNLWAVRNIRDDRIAWGLRWKHVGLSGFGYALWTGDQLEERASENSAPVEQRVVLPWLPKYQVFFRLYSSFTHIASQAQILCELQRARVDAGVIAEAKSNDKLLREQAAEMRRTAMGRWGKRLAVVGCLGLVFALGAALGGAKTPGQTDSKEKAEAAAKPATSPEVEPVSWDGIKLAGVSDEYVRIGRERVKLGDSLPNGAVLVAASRRGRVCMLGVRDDVWVWRLGHASPTRLGTREEVRIAAHAARTAAVARGAAVEVPRIERTGQAVGAAEGERVGGGGSR